MELSYIIVPPILEGSHDKSSTLRARRKALRRASAARPDSTAAPKPAAFRFSSRRDELLIFWLVSLATIIIPFFVAPGMNGFRIGKEILLISAGAAAAGLMLTSALAFIPPFQILWREQRTVLVLVFAAVAWTAIAGAFSVQPVLSLISLVWVATAGAFFIAALGGSSGGAPLIMLSVAIVPAAVNGAVAVLQRVGWWSPVALDPSLPSRIRTSGFVGNPNDLAGYLLLPLIASIALSIVARGWLRWAAGAGAAVILVGLIASETITATVALVAALFAMAALRSIRAVVIVLLVGCGIGVVAWIFDVPIAERGVVVVTQAINGDLWRATSSRTQSWLVAWRMFTENPLTGVGPGCYGLLYLAFKMVLSVRHPEFLASPQNFGEAHNDHLQTLAVSGLPGYFLFVMAVYLLGRVSFRVRGTDLRARFARWFSLPAAIGFAVLSLGQFPLELAAPLAVGLYLAGLAIGWEASCESSD